ncbi:MotA/TolQ/ExbB proton channel family protein [Planctomycetes bacterium K23_9]|uniref:MotA/TolQ/ExbB proton channel family protein n=1 Tax=Stieleria marina TaxID=1930275 RepID=A0A517NP85_9BACT|nr:MotA/TolQ/ExbB proton channel family protein [Planctomycetes bacterium K23_9]
MVSGNDEHSSAIPSDSNHAVGGSLKKNPWALSDDASGNSLQSDSVDDNVVSQAGSLGGGLLPLVAGGVVSILFYGIVHVVPWQPLERYFLGHPVAIAATILFWVATAILLFKWWYVNQQWNYLHAIRDRDLIPPQSDSTPADKWIADNDAGFVARRWMATIAALPAASRASQLVHRIEELLTRQSQRGTSKHLADDLRELSGRDADAAHDSLGLVRIIVWAIPMLGFLGTVIGITQTLGGLDFTDGTGAVDRLKSGLYVAFDTTALGLVLSVLAIFIQFPIERSEQQLLATIDHRVGHLISACLPSDDAVDNQVSLVADLCSGIKAAVAESLASQASLWQKTIDEAHQTWQEVQSNNANLIAEAFQGTLAPALKSHASVMAQSSAVTTTTLQKQTQLWEQTMTTNAAALANHHQKMIKQCEQLASVSTQSKAITTLQQSLDTNLERLDATNRGIDRSVAAAAGEGMADAMRTLARAVDILSAQMPDGKNAANQIVQRRAA